MVRFRLPDALAMVTAVRFTAALPERAAMTVPEAKVRKARREKLCGIWAPRLNTSRAGWRRDRAAAMCRVATGAGRHPRAFRDPRISLRATCAEESASA